MVDVQTAKEKMYVEILDGMVDMWHKVARAHGVKSCNCFREEAGSWLLKYFNVKGNPYAKRTNQIPGVTVRSRFSILVGDERMEMKITRVASRLPARWEGCFTANDKSVDFKEVTLVDNREGLEFPWKFPGRYYLSRATHDSITFYLTMREIQKLKEGFGSPYKGVCHRKD